MSRTSLIGALGAARQSAKDAAATISAYMPVTSTNINPMQNVQTLPPEIGGAYFLRGSYKSSVSGSGDVGMVIRPNQLGNLLMAYSGVDTPTAVPGQAGAYQHVFTPFTPAAGVDLPWYTVVEDVAKLYANQLLNAKMRSLRLDIPKSSILTGQTSWLATTPSQIASITSPTFDTTPQFQTCSATIALTQEGSGTNISANSIRMERISVMLGNQLSEDEFSVGNYFLDDITLLQKSASVDLDLIIRDTALYQAAYYNGNSVGTTWQPQVYRGSLTVTLTSLFNVPATTQPYVFTINFPGLDFMLMPIGQQGADLVRATLSTQVTLGQSGADTYTMTLINGVASY